MSNGAAPETAPAPAGAARSSRFPGTWGLAAVLAVLSLLVPSGAFDPGMVRSLSSVWATMVLLVVAYARLPLRPRSSTDWRAWRAAWTAALLLFLLHCGLSIAGPLGGSIMAMFDTPLVSSPVFNLVLAFWWTVDVALTWLRPGPTSERGVASIQRRALLLVLWVAFLVASVLQGSPTAQVLGVWLALTAVFAWFSRMAGRPLARSIGGAAVLVVLGALGIPEARGEVRSLASCLEAASEGFREVPERRAERFQGKVQDATARCRGGSQAQALRATPWVDWSNYWGAGDSTSLGVDWLPWTRVSPAQRGVDGALLDLEYQRIELIQHNLFDNSGTFADYRSGRDGIQGRALKVWDAMRLPEGHEHYRGVGGDGPQQCRGDLIRFRTLTGICNDLFNPAMGSTGMAFARNVPFEETFPDRGLTPLTRARHGARIDLGTPDPAVLSRVLFTRRDLGVDPCADVSTSNAGATAAAAASASTTSEGCAYRAAPFMNVLAAFWIQFMTHDWFSHLDGGRNASTPIAFPCASPEAACTAAPPMESALLEGTGRTPTFQAEGDTRWSRAPQVSRNFATAWWDASQIYGFDGASAARVKRSPTDPAQLELQGGGPGGGLLPLLAASDPKVPEWAGQEATAFPDNWSVGLSFLHNVFAREHNLFVEAFRARMATDPGGDSGLRDPARPERVIRWADVSDDELFQVARLVVSAEIAKIHTIEWTTQLLYNEPLYRAMNSNWSGLFATDLATRATERVMRRLVASEDETDQVRWYSVFASGSGIFGLGSRRLDLVGRDGWDLTDPEHVNGGVNHFGSPFNFPEEFVSVYRLHPLVPDVLEIRSASAPDQVRELLPVAQTLRAQATSVRDRVGLPDLGVSLGRQRLGLLGLRNHPRILQNLPMPAERTGGTGRLDVAALDLIRDRERGVPRFNEFRRQYGLRSLTSFDDFVDRRLPPDSPEAAEQRALVDDLRRLYGQHVCDASQVITEAQELDGAPITDCLGHPDGTLVDNVEDVDLVVGFLAETTRPHGFAISETQFAVFILNASRRLFSDRFFTSSFRPEFYSHLGIDWVDHNGPDGEILEEGRPNGHAQQVLPFKRVLLRTVPELAPALEGVVNTFDPWSRDRGSYYGLGWSEPEKEGGGVARR